MLCKGERNIQTKVMTTLFALFTEVERDLISERTRDGLAKAKASGRRLGCPKCSLGVSTVRRKAPKHTTVSTVLTSVAILALVACGDDPSPVGPSTTPVPVVNQAPTVSRMLDDVSMPVDSSPVIVDFSSAFSDPDGDTLAYAAQSSDTDVVTVSVSQQSLTMTAVGEGMATVTLTARDPDGAGATSTIAVTVTGPLVDVTAQVVEHWPPDFWYGRPDGRRGVPDATVRNLSSGRAATTDANGWFTVRAVAERVTVRIEKSGYEPRELTVGPREQVVVGHEWPVSARPALDLLRFRERDDVYLILWDGAVPEWLEGAGGEYWCAGNDRIAIVLARSSQYPGLYDHELYHIRQGVELDGNHCRRDLDRWVSATQTGRAYERAWKADLKAGRLIVVDENQDRFATLAHENAAEFFNFYTGTTGYGVPAGIEAFDRHRFFAREYGPAPN